MFSTIPDFWEKSGLENIAVAIACDKLNDVHICIYKRHLEIVNGFDWDEENSKKCWNRVSQEEIEYLFHQKDVLITPDIKHSEDEDRYLAVGVSCKGRHIFVAFTFRNQQEDILIRPISARYMHEKEVLSYEENFPKSQNG